MVSRLASFDAATRLGACLFVVAFGPAPVRADAVSVSFDQTGKLAYKTDFRGARIADFSVAGYKRGEASLPAVTAVISVPAPSGGDDTAPIQRAIDEASQRPLDGFGFRGAVELGRGEFRIAGTLRLAASGIVLRGAGRAATVLSAAGRPHTLIEVAGTGRYRRTESRRRIMDDYVPSGSVRITLDSARGLEPGDDIIVQRPATAEWIAEIGMDRIPPRADGSTKQWESGAGLLFQRRIISIRGNTIELDAALTNAIVPADGGTAWRYRFDGRIQNVGIENLSASGQAFFRSFGYQKQSRWTSQFLSFDAVRDGWLRDVTIRDFNGAIAIKRTASRLTLTNFSVFNGRNIERRGAVPAAVSIWGQLIEVRDCLMSGRYFMAWATQSFAAGPNAIHHCYAYGTGINAGAHQRWATGLLMDNVRVPGRLELINRGNHGTGQGWTAANSVIWNSRAAAIAVENPPAAENLVFGSITPDGGRDSPADPTSLFEAQRRERLGVQ